MSFTPAETAFLNSHSICRFATVSAEGQPHNVPVGYAFDGQLFYVSTRYGTKKLQNLRGNPRVALIVDEPPKPRKAVVVQGICELLEKGADFNATLRKIVEQRGEKWGFKEGEQSSSRCSRSRKPAGGCGFKPVHQRPQF